VALICSAVDAEALPTETRGLFLHEVRMQAPPIERQRQLFTSLWSSTVERHSSGHTTLDVDDALKLLAVCSPNEIASITTYIGTMLAARAQQPPVMKLTDVEEALSVIPIGPSSMVDQPKIPNVRWTDIGGEYP